MVKFVWLDVVGGGQVPVNPEAVLYLRRTKEGHTALVFGAFAGGWHELEVDATAAAAVALLQGQVAVPGETKAFHPSARARRRAQTA